MRLIALPTSDGGSIAPVGIFAAIRRASSRVSGVAAARVIEIDIRKLLPVGVDYDKARF